MAEDRKEYTVVIGGIPHTFLLSAEQAKERGLSDKDVTVKAAPAPANKARVPNNK